MSKHNYILLDPGYNPGCLTYNSLTSWYLMSAKYNCIVKTLSVMKPVKINSTDHSNDNGYMVVQSVSLVVWYKFRKIQLIDITIHWPCRIHNESLVCIYTQCMGYINMFLYDSISNF